MSDDLLKCDDKMRAVRPSRRMQLKWQVVVMVVVVKEAYEVNQGLRGGWLYCHRSRGRSHFIFHADRTMRVFYRQNLEYFTAS